MHFALYRNTAAGGLWSDAEPHGSIIDGVARKLPQHIFTDQALIILHLAALGFRKNVLAVQQCQGGTKPQWQPVRRISRDHMDAAGSSKAGKVVGLSWKIGTMLFKKA